MIINYPNAVTAPNKTTGHFEKIRCVVLFYDAVRSSSAAPCPRTGHLGTGRQRLEINSPEAGRLSSAVMPKTTRYKHKEGRHLCTRTPR
jgi:hypothetical protein